MIEFHTEHDFMLEDQEAYRTWILEVVASEQKEVGEINYIFCDDEYLHKINVEFLDHDTFTDIISFDYTVGDLLSGDIYISVDRVKENALIFKTSFEKELRRVMVHGILHYCGYKDKLEEERAEMRSKEDFYLKQ